MLVLKVRYKEKEVKADQKFTWKGWIAFLGLAETNLLVMHLTDAGFDWKRGKEESYVGEDDAGKAWRTKFMSASSIFKESFISNAVSMHISL